TSALIFGVGVGKRLEAAVTASSLAIVGYDDFEDSFTVVALDGLTAGETIYFTNNGWSSTQGKFNGADVSQGAGNESLIQLTLIQNVPKGSVMFSGSNTAGWQWTKTGVIPGQDGGLAEFSDLSLDYESDQIYAFQGTAANPLLNPTNFIYALHFGSVDYPGFSDSEDLLTGDIPPGLSTGLHTAFAHTNFAFHGDADGNHSAWGLNFADPDVAVLQAAGGTKAQWLNLISDSSNWGNGQPTVVDFHVMPEPSRALLLMTGLVACLCRRQRHGNYINFTKL
ncbi:MAG: hypothetical protein JNG86_23095, partial [Verrucomicrobiaceae bacterium]|nr:hypothetical protein [Verrucomicrobiaceae bacterium]